MDLADNRGGDGKVIPNRGNPRRWPARSGCPVGRLGHLEVVYASDMLDDAVAGVVPDVHAEGEARLGLHRQVRLDSRRESSRSQKPNEEMIITP
jgi:hypothetical protein